MLFLMHVFHCGPERRRFGSLWTEPRLNWASTDTGFQDEALRRLVGRLSCQGWRNADIERLGRTDS